ncbi:phage tail assembly chaperone [Pseudochrobactrum sp. sp1633]|uniref:rcc01693 family protein n=1 Tax=Pseudochrobactrum sp. sp1633 TaxID=3036706 RepID=UPI0025A4E25B|nr:rcc01693 family protein [Pseudochrobactrum sp. sp1633]MDM8345169.1 phage tail assembly chaperone [Pseudochrobactrum sp. sp1633]HWD12980.1 rcc01693 family protein [Pseudochrobactrum sp.]
MSFPWDALMHFGLGQLRLSSKDFWRLSMLEIRALNQSVRGGRQAPSRDILTTLMRAFPDGEI